MGVLILNDKKYILIVSDGRESMRKDLEKIMQQDNIVVGVDLAKGPDFTDFKSPIHPAYYLDEKSLINQEYLLERINKQMKKALELHRRNYREAKR